MMQRRDDQSREIPPLVREKLAVFDGMMHTFQANFAYVEQMHGQRRFGRVPIAAIVQYLHALWLCECKDALLSIPQKQPRYDRRHTLDLLLAWQDGVTADVVAFLELKLDPLSFVRLTHHIQQAEQAMQQAAQWQTPTAQEAAVVDRLRHGRAILLNRSMNLHRALEAIFALPTDALVVEVRAACVRYGHSPEQIHEQQASCGTSLYSYLPHPELARRNMLLMNRAGMGAANTPMDRPGERTAHVLRADRPLPAYADAPLAHKTSFTPQPFSLPPHFATYIPPASGGVAETLNSGQS